LHKFDIKILIIIFRETNIEVDPVHPMKGNVIKKSFGALSFIYTTLGNSRYTYDNIIKDGLLY